MINLQSQLKNEIVAHISSTAFKKRADERDSNERLVLPDIMSKSRSADSDSTMLKPESREGSEKHLR